MQPPNPTSEMNLIANLQRREKRSRTATDQSQRDSIAWEMHKAGKTWQQVAEEIGYANGAIARRAALRYKAISDADLIAGLIAGLSEPKA